MARSKACSVKWLATADATAVPSSQVSASGSSTPRSRRARERGQARALGVPRPARFTRRLAALRRSRFEQVADAAQRADAGAAARELLAQARDEGLERVVAERPRRRSRACRTGCACCTVRPGGLISSHSTSNSRAGRSSSSPPIAKRRALRSSCSCAEHGDVVGALGAPHQRTQPGLDLGQVEGLAQVVVGAGVEAGDALVGAVARGEHQHRRAVAARARLAQRGEAAAQAAGGAGVRGQVEVEQHGIEGLHAPEVVGVLDVGRHVDAVARVAPGCAA